MWKNFSVFPTFRKFLFSSRKTKNGSNLSIGLVLPNGDKVWPTVGEPLFRCNISNKIIRHQVIQKTLTTLEIRVELVEPLDETEEENLKKLILNTLGYEHLSCYVVKVDKFPDGKFEAFKCEI